MLGFGNREFLNLHSRPRGFHNHGQSRAALSPGLSQCHWSLRCRVSHSRHMQVALIPLQCIGKIELCRDGALCLLKRGWPSAKLLCQLDSQPVGLLRREKNIIIACMDQTLMCLTNKVCHPAYTPPTLCGRANECGSKSCRRQSLASSRWTSPVVASA